MVGKGERAGARSWAANEAGALPACPSASLCRAIVAEKVNLERCSHTKP